MSKQDTFFLPETNLKCEQGFLIRTDDDGNQTFKIPLSSIQSVRSKKTLGAFGVVLVTAAATIAWIGYEIPNNTPATAFLYVLATFIGLFGALGLVEHKITFETFEGPLSIKSSEESGVIEGFLMTLRRMMKEAR